ncbi:MAG: TolC family outer membrane protein [Phenylobacterium sp.]|uniref:TolC family outer membrane protein n=1 Tax=Phenylobacterium sp. TaxID=1871053 RepID=UPI002733E829|nr:TolC family outer membrane protein [Phenylobacterium sp.]MDP3748573.1 TolC family outer membrane protein [Phenylobacterium sp.]
MFNSRRGALLAAVCLAGLGCAAPAFAETLAEAIALAYDSNPTLQAQRATQRALDEGYVQARTGYRPTLSASVQGSYSETRTPGGVPQSGGVRLFGPIEDNSGSATFNLTQPLFTGGRTAAAVSAAEADILTGRENLRRIESQVLANVITAYVDTRRDIEALRIRQENVRVLERQLEESKARFDVGEITRTDVAQSEARLAAAQFQFSQAQSQLAISRANYAAVVGQNPGDLAPEPSLAALMPTDVAQAFDAAENSSPQIRGAEYTQQASRARLAGARAERMPSLALRGTVGWRGQADPLETEDYARDVTGAAVLTVPLFTGGLTNSRVRAQIERNNVDRIGVETARRNVLQGLTQSWSQLIAARANIGSSDEQVRAARIAAEGTRQEQQVGLRTTLDVLNAEQELRSAELAQVSARRDEYVAATNVLALMGRLEAPNLTPTVTRYDPKTNFSKLRFTWGWVPWEEPIAIVDGVLTPKPVEKPMEAAPTAPK